MSVGGGLVFVLASSIISAAVLAFGGAPLFAIPPVLLAIVAVAGLWLWRRALRRLARARGRR